MPYFIRKNTVFIQGSESLPEASTQIVPPLAKGEGGILSRKVKMAIPHSCFHKEQEDK